ncbi:2-hydroxychromene-2-carboxylate isomerase [Cocleimonas sp. KMM 6892]|uniref:2-hydroxychromene-2-carboxylate isomerase n=1 Tax=unclassified Cocleimonas TaxID=2639732 RepID=UPI002DBF39A1|nr:MULTISPECIES: 2-hydroxychromene-2-carboxylate isomerase [unclassified Cocleimonas]MEB8434288.1 2-hydroxychromene-2-carboxylate isomerase [Cocleimonas sp. KMM 6892]MEC4717093.1 2-hydroxychromene-2-carboxylate isomerase [Cocleimonas sp. KMM 6895]MEC4746560.1 2-hydroxychromene-2-carboxylate isomerase [Cocleimonas sp. KMM 6896]
MSKTINYYHFLISPFSYLAIERFNALAAKHDLTVNYLPISVMDVFSELEVLPPGKRHPSLQKMRMDELKRWSGLLDLPMNFTPAHFPVDQTLAAQMVLAAGGASANPDAGKLSDALLKAVWEQEKNISDEATLIAIADSVGLEGLNLLESARDEQWANAYANTTKEALEAGVVGSPTYQLDDELYWGQDRLDFLERAIG